jgi:hypothetical protein
MGCWATPVRVSCPLKHNDRVRGHCAYYADRREGDLRVHELTTRLLLANVIVGNGKRVSVGMGAYRVVLLGEMAPGQLCRRGALLGVKVPKRRCPGLLLAWSGPLGSCWVVARVCPTAGTT